MGELQKPLSQRKKQILKAIIEAHIANGEPVGSKYLIDSQQFSCSSATIRNEMADLEALGYLEQPHTSAGRVPSEAGYRFYVDTLLEEYAMTTKEIQEINDMMKTKAGELDQILNMASKVASNMTHYTAIAVKPKVSQLIVTKFETVRIDEHRFLLVMVSSNDAVQTKTITVTSTLTDGSVQSISQALNSCIAGKSADEITLPVMMDLESKMGQNTALITPVMKLVYEVMNGYDQGELNVSGLDKLLDYPEYKDVEGLRQLIGTIEDKNEIVDLVSEAEKDKNNIVIGSESEVKVMENSSLVFKPVLKDGKTVGAIGVIGPVRMDYARVLALLDTLTGNITDMLDDKTKLLKGDTKDDSAG